MRKGTTEARRAEPSPAREMKDKKTVLGKPSRDRIVKLLMGTREKNGLVKSAAVYALLICIGFTQINGSIFFQ